MRQLRHSTILLAPANNPNAWFRFQLETVTCLVVVTFLTFSALMYLMARQGALYRFRDHSRVPRGELDRHFTEYAEGITGPPGHWGNGASASLNAVLAAGAIRAYIGVRKSVVDVFLGVVNWLYISPRPKKAKVSLVVEKTTEEVNWESILYPGDRRPNRDLRGSTDRRRRIAVR